MNGRAHGSPRSPSSWPMWVLGLVVLTDQIDQNILRGVLEQLRAEFALSDPQLGVLASSFILVNGLVTVPAGYLADRWNRTRTVGNTMLVWSGITAVTAAAPNYGALVAVRSALGFGQAITEPAANSLVADYYPLSHRGRAFSIQQVMGLLGIGVGIGLGGLVGAALGWRWAFLIVGSPSIVVAFMVFRLREPRRGASDRLHLGVASHEEEGPGRSAALVDRGARVFTKELLRGLAADMRTISRIRTMRYALVGVSVLLFTVTGISVWLPSFYERQLGVSAGAAQLLVGSLIIVGGIRGGIFTPTEAAAVAAFYALLVGVLLYRTLGTAAIWQCLFETASMSAGIMLIVAMASMTSFILGFENVPRTLAGHILGITSDPTLLLLLLNLILLI
ncbi:MAG: MFS transporter, partial [Actinobacteria bacterium]|nr:MFS transporter [Actinomycetota bacterium]